jgi:hypothetical protein
LEEKSEEGRIIMKNADLNELAFTKLMLFIDVSNTSSTTYSEEITVGNGNKMLPKKVGSLRCIVQQKKRETFVFVLKDVNYVPELWSNLFSISKALKHGFNLGNEDVAMKLMKVNILTES